MIEHALPLWATQGWDSRRGGFVERLAPDGTADSEAPRRLRVQARQIYCFARAAQIGWYPPGRDLALRGLEHMLATSKSPDGRPGFVSLLAPDGAVLSTARDTYDHAFVLLALAHAFQFDRDAQIRAEIESAVAFLDHHLKSEHGGYIEGIPASLPRRQNPHMHLFEAMIALFDATHEIGFQNRAGEFYSLFLAHFFDARTGLLGEYFEDDWSRILPLSIEPGHQAEWVWLLKNFQRITGCPTDKHRAALLASALRYSDARTRCLVDEGNIDGHIVKPSGRCWPQTELARAWMAQAESGVPGASDAALEALARVERYYLRHPVRGGWYDRFDHDETARAAFIPATSFYHVLGAVVEAERVLGT
ncbi:MAG: AGE family epimerase/isomerase [Xanthobacteraceae bacterium]